MARSATCRSIGLVRVLAWLSLGASWLAAAGAQTADPAEYAARAVARVAYIDLRCRPMPQPDDFLIAERLLAGAAAFRPDDAELLRARIQASWSAGDSERVDDLTRQLVLLDPRDTVAQLRLASSRMRRIQTVEERLAAYDRLLGPAGARLDPSVRSRLALDAALLCRERRDFAGFADRLAQAAQLDSTNKEAASLAWTYFGPLVATRPDRLELLLNLLMSDPTDPNIHRQIASELALGGEFEQAQRFHTIAVQLNLAKGPQLDERLAIEASMIRWQVEGPEAVVESLNRELLAQRQAAAMRIMQWEQARMPTDSLPKPETIMLAPTYNQIRLVAAIMADDKQTIGATLNDMTNIFQRTLAQAAEVAQLSTPEERAQRLGQLWAGLTEQLVAIAWADASTESIREWAARAAQSFGPDAEVARILNAWAELRLGDPAFAERQFRLLPDTSLLSRVGLQIAIAEQGRTDEANEHLHALATEAPLSLAGVWARSQFRRATGVDPLATPERAALQRLAQGVPAWVDRMALDPRRFMSLQVEAERLTLSATDRTQLRIRLTNISPVPLGIGGDRTINSRLLLAPRLETSAGAQFARARPEVREIDQRLRLMPTESIEIVVWPDPGIVGWLAEVGALDTVRERWRVLQGFSMDEQGVPQAGILCLEAEAGVQVRSPLTLGRVSATELADAIDSAAQSELPDVLAAIRARALLGPESPLALAGDDLSRIASIAAERYPELSEASRAAMLAVLPSARIAPGMEPFDAAALAEQDPRLAPVALVTRITDADDATLERWCQSEDPAMSDFAQALRNRLRSPAATFSRLLPSDLAVALAQPPAER